MSPIAGTIAASSELPTRRTGVDHRQFAPSTGAVRFHAVASPRLVIAFPPIDLGGFV